MPAAVAVRVEGVASVLGRIGALEERIAHPAPGFAVVADLLELHVAKTFASEGSWIGQPWAPLAPRTLMARLKRWGYYRRWAPMAPEGILQWHGRLRRSFTRAGVGNIRQVSDSGLTFGTGVTYANYHQSLLPRMRLPRRPMLGWRDTFQEREVIFQPLRLWLQGTPPGAIITVMRARLGV